MMLMKSEKLNKCEEFQQIQNLMKPSKTSPSLLKEPSTSNDTWCFDYN
jgi:hypothetical protein